MNAVTAGHVGTPQLRQLNMVNIDMFRHPKYYKELRKRNKSDQAISDSPESRVRDSVRPDPGLKRQASSAKPIKPQAASFKPIG